MMKMKRYVSMLLAVLLLVSLVPAGIPAASAAEATSEPWNDGISLPFSSYEYYVLLLTNRERLAEGLAPLTGCDILQEVCDVRAEEICDNFSHYRPDGTDCFSALDDADVEYYGAGENIASGYTSPASVVRGWMNSSGHRRNILLTSFTHLGVGYLRNRWVQMFTCARSEIYSNATIHYPKKVEAGTDIDDMFIYATLENNVYGTCYLPISSEFVTGYNPKVYGVQELKISFLDFTGTISLTTTGDCPITVTSHPTTQKVIAGKTATFRVTAKGSGLTYQWQYRKPDGANWYNCTADGNKTATMKVAATTGKSNYRYRCRITDSDGYVTYTNTVRLYTLGVTSQPTVQKVLAGTTATFTVSATGYLKTYQWQYKTPDGTSWYNCTAPGNKTATMKVAATTGKSNYRYRCKITDGAGNVVYSNTVRLYALGINDQPKSVSVEVCDAVTFTVSATGHQKTFQWQYKAPGGEWENTAAKGCRTATLTVPGNPGRNGYQYRCIITDSVGNTVTSEAATLTIK